MKYKKAKNVKILGEFKNECLEEFVILLSSDNQNEYYPNLYITGDEFDWELVELCVLGKKSNPFIFATNNGFRGRFLFSPSEKTQIHEIIKKFKPNDDEYVDNIHFYK